MPEWDAMLSIARGLWRLPRNILIAVIIGYQATLSPDHGPLRHMHPYGFCRHEPTCSEYGKQALESQGVVIGLLLLLWRILSCHPWREPEAERMRKILKSQTR